MQVEMTGGASTTSRRPDRMLTGLKVDWASGRKVYLDGIKEPLVDWQMGLAGPLFGLEYWWLTYERGAMRDGHFPPTSIAPSSESLVANMLGGFYPDVEAIRFMCNGSDACASAVKLARAYTGRDKILSYGYHGTASCFAPPPEANARPGLPAQDMRGGTLKAERDAFVPLEWMGDYRLDDIAAVIVECPPADGGRTFAADWLNKLSLDAEGIGALFILDEVVTGFRYGPGGAAEYYGLQGLVDLYCFGKTLGNGFPIAALAGRKEIMDLLTQNVHFSGTFFGAPIGLEAARATLQRLRSDPPWPHLYEVGEYLKKEWNGATPYPLVGHPTRPIIDDATIDDKFTDLRRHLFNSGHICVSHPWYVSTAHKKEDVDSLVSAAKEWKA